MMQWLLGSNLRRLTYQKGAVPLVQLHKLRHVAVCVGRYQLPSAKWAERTLAQMPLRKMSCRSIQLAPGIQRVRARSDMSTAPRAPSGSVEWHLVGFWLRRLLARVAALALGQTPLPALSDAAAYPCLLPQLVQVLCYLQLV